MWRCAALLLTCCIIAFGACATPRPAAAPAADARAVNASCEGCHAEAAATWRGSLHAQAFTDPVFQTSLAREPSPFCRDCHAPIAAAPELGIACTSCHGAAPHEPAARVALGSSQVCARCHEFPFPDQPEARMQRTMIEHRASRFADRSCQSCHMPKDGAARSHGFTVDRTLLARALVVRAERTPDGVSIELAPGNVGHAFPTGDLFRRLVVIADVEAEDHRLVAHSERALARHFRYEPTGAAGTLQQHETSDDRVQGGVQRVVVPIAAALPHAAVSWRVEWQRVQAMHDDEAEVAERVVVAEGRIER